MARDKKIGAGLRREGWKVLRFWEHDIADRPEKVVDRIRRELGKRKK